MPYETVRPMAHADALELIDKLVQELDTMPFWPADAMTAMVHADDGRVTLGALYGGVLRQLAASIRWHNATTVDSKPAPWEPEWG